MRPVYSISREGKGPSRFPAGGHRMRAAIGLTMGVAAAPITHPLPGRSQVGDHPAAQATVKARTQPASAATPLPLPSDLKVPSYPPGPPTFHDGETLFYEATWLGAPAAQARVVVSVNRQHP